jgi:hypothetical protein
MNGSAAENDRHSFPCHCTKPILDPRLGDMENDHFATKRRLFLAVAGSPFVEISLTKLSASRQ